MKKGRGVGRDQIGWSGEAFTATFFFFFFVWGKFGGFGGVGELEGSEESIEDRKEDD